MAKLLIFLALCILPALVTSRPARPAHTFFHVQGRVFCDTCRAGFETKATTYIHGAKVRVECKDRDSLKLLYFVDGETDKTGTYNIRVLGDHGDQMCESLLLSSPQSECAIIDPARDRARVFPTSNNGITSNVRYANNLGFIMDAPLAECAEVLKLYQETED